MFVQLLSVKIDPLLNPAGPKKGSASWLWSRGMQGNTVVEYVGDWDPWSCLSTVAPTVRSILLLGNIWITIRTCISLRKEETARALVTSVSSIRVLYQENQIKSLWYYKETSLHGSNQRENRMISVSDPSFLLASGTVCMCVHRHHAHQNAGGGDTVESIDFLQFVQILRRQLHNLSYENMEILKK